MFDNKSVAVVLVVAARMYSFVSESLHIAIAEVVVVVVVVVVVGAVVVVVVEVVVVVVVVVVA